jgi:hypothetical protein
MTFGLAQFLVWRQEMNELAGVGIMNKILEILYN